MRLSAAKMFKGLLVAGTMLLAVQQLSAPVQAETTRWTTAKANQWYGEQRWLVGANFLPTNAINQFEMWQADTFSPSEIDKEFGYAEGIGMNTMRIFLHDQLWVQDPEGFKKRINIVLDLAAKHHIKPMLVLFDSCWDPNPKLGLQHAPVPGVHNSGWVQSPGTEGLMNEAGWPKYESYVKGIVGTFGKDDRILAWDVWNEPDNRGGGNYDQLPDDVKTAQVAKLLPQVYAWVRSQDPKQPLTSGVWHNDDWSPKGKLNAVERVQIDQSDVISFHSYDWPERLEERIKSLQPYGRPLLMTEYMARGNGSTFDSALPMARKYNVAAINWGFVLGKSQTNMPWDSWEKPYVKSQPTLWFHDIFYPDGKAYRQAEVDQIRAMTAEAQTEFARTQPALTGKQLQLVDTVSRNGARATKAAALKGYLFVYFKDETHSLYFATSTDGYSFTDVNSGEPVATGRLLAEQKGIRDPYIYRGSDGAFYMAMTDLHIFGQRDGVRTTEWERPGEIWGWGNNQNLIFMKSYDLIHWTHHWVPVHNLFPETKDWAIAWAPELIVDPTNNKLMVYFTTREKGQPDHMVYSYADKAFSTLETVPKTLFTYPVAGKGTIDGDITKVGNTYHMFYVAHDQPGFLRQAVSTKINEGYIYSPQKIDPETVGTEAPMLWRRSGTDTYVLMYDVFGAQPHNNMGFSETTDFVHFKDIGRFNEPGSPMKATNFEKPKHGAIIPVSLEDINLLTQYFAK